MHQDKKKDLDIKYIDNNYFNKKLAYTKRLLFFKQNLTIIARSAYISYKLMMIQMKSN